MFLNSKSLLVAQNFKIGFISIEAIIFTFWVMGSLEKGCFKLNISIQLSSWIYTEMKKY